MSCTENESGPFVVFFLPAVVGCLTILLARRWANSQVVNTSTTAVSRRRKIIKDPLIKRPLPPIACKMVAPGSKKSSGVSKKGSVCLPEDEINNGTHKRVRTPRVPTSANLIPEMKMSEGPVPPKHVPFPYIPQDGELLYEAMTFVFVVVATGLQYLNLYKTAWWLDQPHVTETMHFYLIDVHIVVFIVVLASRRLLLCGSLALLQQMLPESFTQHAVKPARGLILGMLGGVLLWLTYIAANKYSFIKIFYLVYPAVVYLLLFGLDSGPFMELNNPDPPLHCCTHDPELLRAEVDSLRHDFNLRVKKILFNSVVGAYYSSFIPCCFAPPFLHYSVQSAAQHTAVVWLGLFGWHCSQLLAAAYCDVPHRAALHLGRWTTIHEPLDGEGLVPWSGGRVWAGGSRVAARGAAFEAAANTVAAAPADTSHARFYSVFINPSVLLCVLLCLQLALVMVQLVLLFTNTFYHCFISIIMLLFINYYTLFKMARDYVIASKVYNAESIIQDKNQNLSNG